MSIPQSVPADILRDPRALYDFFMQFIEPDLMTKNIPTLDAPYAGETPEEKEDRYAQYEAAYLLFNRVTARFFADAELLALRLINEEKLAAEIAEAESKAQKIDDLTKKIHDEA